MSVYVRESQDDGFAESRWLVQGLIGRWLSWRGTANPSRSLSAT